MLTITLKLSKKFKQHLDKDLKKLENITHKPRKFHFEKALIWYLEEVDRKMKLYKKERGKGNLKSYTEDDLLEKLGLKETDWEKDFNKRPLRIEKNL